MYVVIYIVMNLPLPEMFLSSSSSELLSGRLQFKLEGRPLHRAQHIGQLLWLLFNWCCSLNMCVSLWNPCWNFSTSAVVARAFINKMHSLEEGLREGMHFHPFHSVQTWQKYCVKWVLPTRRTSWSFDFGLPTSTIARNPFLLFLSYPF